MPKGDPNRQVSHKINDQCQTKQVKRQRYINLTEVGCALWDFPKNPFAPAQFLSRILRCGTTKLEITGSLYY